MLTACHEVRIALTSTPVSLPSWRAAEPNQFESLIGVIGPRRSHTSAAGAGRTAERKMDGCSYRSPYRAAAKRATAATNAPRTASSAIVAPAAASPRRASASYSLSLAPGKHRGQLERAARHRSSPISQHGARTNAASPRGAGGAVAHRTSSRELYEVEVKLERELQEAARAARLQVGCTEA
eukprot:SAG11_NODE_509_length_8856_cov_2.930798_1_plen_182_part_00